MNGKERENRFGKVVATLFLIWLFMYLWTDRFVYYQALLRTNKFTGSVSQYDAGKWKPWE